jgi:hypothetical protein
MEMEAVVIISNTLVMLATFLATLYRIKIEHDHARTVKQNAKAKGCLESLRKYAKTERNMLSSMNKDDREGFLDYLERLGER